MQARSLVENPERRLETLKRSLTEKFSACPERVEVEAQENRMISEAIKRISFPFSIKDFLVYINEETANLLAQSSHSLLKEWGDKCKSFYTMNPLNKYVQSTTGLVSTPPLGRGNQYGIQMVYGGYGCEAPMIVGYGVWNKITNKWVPSPGTTSNHDLNFAFNCWLYNSIIHGSALLPPLNPPNIAEHPFALLSSFHVAALIGDTDLMQALEREANFDNDCNQWHVTPVELAIIHEQTDIVDFLCQRNIDKTRALKIAVEKGSFAIIEIIINNDTPITNEIIAAARARDQELFFYMEIKRKILLQQLIERDGSLKALQAILDYPHIPFQSLVDLICAHPEVINDIVSEVDGNTVLHQLVIAKDTVKVKTLMEAILEAGLFKDLSFDIEKKNKAHQTVLNLALASQNKDLISAILLYGKPNTTSLELQIAAANINIPAIMNERAKLDQKAREKISHMLLTTTQSEMETNVNLGIVAAQQQAMAAHLERLTEKVDIQTQQNARLMELVETLLIECQESRRECVELRALLQTQPSALPSTTSTPLQTLTVFNSHARIPSIQTLLTASQDPETLTRQIGNLNMSSP